jgi:hypothetical protein
MANSVNSVYVKPTVAFNRGDTFVFGSWVCTADSVGSFQRCLTMPPNPETGVVTLPEVVTGELAGKFGLDPPPTRTRRPRGLSYASRLLSHRMQTPHPASASHVAPATPAGPTRRLPLPAGPARRSYPSTTRTPTPPPATPQLQPPLRLLLGLCIRVRLRVRPGGARVRGQHYRATSVRAGFWPSYNIYTRREIRLLARP